MTNNKRVKQPNIKIKKNMMNKGKIITQGDELLNKTDNKA